MATNSLATGRAELSFIIIDLACYGLLLLATIYIIVRFLILQKKAEIMYVSTFYIFTAILSITKLYALSIQYKHLHSDEDDHDHSKFLNSIIIAEQIGFTCYVFIGFIQVAQMTELGIQIKMSALVMSENEAKLKVSKVKLLFYVALVVNCLVAIFCTYLEIQAH